MAISKKINDQTNQPSDQQSDLLKLHVGTKNPWLLLHASGGGDGQTLNLVGGAYFSFGGWGNGHIGVIVEKTWLRTDIQYGHYNMMSQEFVH